MVSFCVPLAQTKNYFVSNLPTLRLTFDLLLLSWSTPHYSGTDCVAIADPPQDDIAIAVLTWIIVTATDATHLSAC